MCNVRICMRLLVSAGALESTAAQVSAKVERSAAQLIAKLQAAGCDALGFGYLAARGYADIPSWEAGGWRERYQRAQVRAAADVRIQ